MTAIFPLPQEPAYEAGSPWAAGTTALYLSMCSMFWEQGDAGDAA